MGAMLKQASDGFEERVFLQENELEKKFRMILSNNIQFGPFFESREQMVDYLNNNELKA